MCIISISCSYIAISPGAPFVIPLRQTFLSMHNYLLLRAKRAFVSVLLKLAFEYGIAADVNRESDDKAISQAYRRVVRKVHPDKGGSRRNSRRCRLPRKLGTLLGKVHALQATLRCRKVSLFSSARSLDNTGFLRRPC